MTRTSKGAIEAGNNCQIDVEETKVCIVVSLCEVKDVEDGKEGIGDGFTKRVD
jgi:hypothetical protein